MKREVRSKLSGELANNTNTNPNLLGPMSISGLFSFYGIVLNIDIKK